MVKRWALVPSDWWWSSVAKAFDAVVSEMLLMFPVVHLLSSPRSGKVVLVLEADPRTLADVSPSTLAGLIVYSVRPGLVVDSMESWLVVSLCLRTVISWLCYHEDR